MTFQIPRSARRRAAFPAFLEGEAASLFATLHQLEATQWLSPAELGKLQLHQLRQVLEFAAKNVPYYRELFRTISLDAEQVTGLEVLNRVPPLTRKAVQTAGEQLRAPQVPRGHGKVQTARTSGSTGQPVTVFKTGHVHFLWRAFSMREHAWHGRDFSRKVAGIRWLPGSSPDRSNMQGWGRTVGLLYEAGPSAGLHVRTPLREQVDWLLQEQPAYLISFPSNLLAIARFSLQHRVDFPFLLQVRAVGESVSRELRDTVRKAWNVDLVDNYSCEEAGYLAMQCPESEHYHVQSENVHLEIVDDEGRPCAVGQPGRVLLTTLHNFAMPLIRYEVGDIAEAGPPCACGRGLPVLKRVLGRKRNRLLLPDGRNEFPYLGEHGQIQALTGVEVRQFQTIQHTREEIEVQLVTDREFTDEERAKAERHIQTCLGYSFRVRFSFHAEIPKSRTGKFEEFICKVPS